MDSEAARNGATPIDHPYVAEHPGVCGGYPVIRNMRFPVRILVQRHRQGASVDELVELYGQLTREQIQGALEYYAAYPDRVDEDIETNERAYAALIERNVPIQGRPWPG